jgi:hypothetical protein
MGKLFIILNIILCSISTYGQYFAPSFTTIYQDNEITSGQRFGLDMKYYALHADKEYFFDWAYAYGGNQYSDNDLLRFGFGCKTGHKIKYGAMMSAIGYRTVNYPESTKDLYTASVAFSPIFSIELNKYFYTEIGMTVTAFQVGDFEVNNSYFLSFGMRWH